MRLSPLIFLVGGCLFAGCGGDDAAAPASPGAGAGGGGQGGAAGQAGAAGEAGMGDMGGMAGMGGAAPEAKPLPAVEGLIELEDLNPDPTIVEVNLAARAGLAQLRKGKQTKVLTYNDLVPGPLLHARVGDRVIVHFTNELDEPTIVHWHGLRISDQMDGSPRIQQPLNPGESFTYDFVVPDAGTFWYHTHLHQIEQFERGLYGALVVHEAEPPAFTAERIFVLDDVRLNSSNQISPFETSGPDIGRGRVGDTLLINGKQAPEKGTLARGAIERWRFVAATNALEVGLRFQGAKARVISTDGGLLPQPFDLDRVEIAPGQRYDFEVRALDDATEVKLEALVLALDANNNVIEVPTTLVQSAIEGEATADEPVYPAITLPEISETAPNENWKLSGGVVDGKVQFSINGQPGTVGGGAHDHTLLATYPQGQPVQLTIRSDVSPMHPFHLHGQFFQIIKRAGKPVFEPGLRDTVAIRGPDSVTILSYFENPGRWMIHCHISEHAENGMMGDIEVTPAAGGEPAPHSH